MKKSLKFLSLIGVSALLFACNNTNNNEGVAKALEKFCLQKD